MKKEDLDYHTRYNYDMLLRSLTYPVSLAHMGLKSTRIPTAISGVNHGLQHPFLVWEQHNTELCRLAYRLP